MATYKVDALILKKKNYKEADRIITIFSRGVGKMDVRAKGVRRSQSRLAGHLETFSYANLLLAEGRTFDIVTQANLYEGFGAIRRELARMAEAFSAFELLDAITPSGYKDSSLFDFILDYLRELEKVPEKRIPVLRQSFEIRLIDVLGFLPNLVHCSECGSAFELTNIFFDTASLQLMHEKHISTTSRGFNVTSDTRKVMRFFLEHPFSSVQRLVMPDVVYQEIERVIHVLLENISDKRIRSKKIFGVKN